MARTRKRSRTSYVDEETQRARRSSSSSASDDQDSDGEKSGSNGAAVLGSTATASGKALRGKALYLAQQSAQPPSADDSESEESETAAGHGEVSGRSKALPTRNNTQTGRLPWALGDGMAVRGDDQGREVMGAGGDDASSSTSTSSSESSSSSNSSSSSVFNDAVLHVRIVPLLQLHSSSADEAETNTLACNVNCRCLNVARMSCMSEEDNMVKMMRAESDCDYVSVANGLVVAVVTSFREGADEQPGSIPMTSVKRPQQNTSPYSAIPLTVEILKEAIAFLKGNSGVQQDDAMTVTTVEEGLGHYIKLLEETVPSDMDADKLMTFIEEREWPADSWGLNELPERSGDAYFLQRYIHENLARATKIMVHIVDGIHRMTATDLTLIGYRRKGDNSPATQTAIDEYRQRLPHKNKTINMKFCTPNSIDDTLVRKMKCISAGTQKMACSQKNHDIRDIIANDIPMLSAQCEKEKIPFLWDGLGYVFKKLADVQLSEEECAVMMNGIDLDNASDDGRAFSERITSDLPPALTERYKILELYVRCWVEKMASKITELIETSSHKTMFGTQFELSDEAGIDSLFQRTYHERNQQIQKCDIFPFQAKAMQTLTFLEDKRREVSSDVCVKVVGAYDEFRSVFKDDRHGKKPYTDETLLVCQILLWSRTDKKAQSSLTKLFSGLHPDQQQYTAGSVDDAFRWTTNVFHSICDAVCESYQPWKVGFFIPARIHPIQCNPEQVILLCLLGSAIEECAAFFPKLGIKPVLPPCEFFNRVREKISEMRNDNLLPDLISTLTLSHVLRLSTMPEGYAQLKRAEKK